MKYKINFTNKTTGTSWNSVSSYSTREQAHEAAKKNLPANLTYCVIRGR